MFVCVFFWFLLFVVSTGCAFFSYSVFGYQVGCENEKGQSGKKDSKWRQAFDSSVFVCLLYKFLNWLTRKQIVCVILDFCRRHLLFELFGKLISMYLIPSVFLLFWYIHFFAWFVQMVFGDSLNVLGLNSVFEAILAGTTVCGAYLVGCFKVFDAVVKDFL